jgi:predicted DNA-binding transcriptional regulator YafY
MPFDEDGLKNWKLLPRQSFNKSELMQDSVGQRLVYALDNNKHLEIIYSSRETPLSRRTIRPIEIVCKSGLIYIVAYCFLRKEERTFRLDRILGARVIGGPDEYSSEITQKALPYNASQEPEVLGSTSNIYLPSEQSQNRRALDSGTTNNNSTARRPWIKVVVVITIILIILISYIISKQ